MNSEKKPLVDVMVENPRDEEFIATGLFHTNYVKYCMASMFMVCLVPPFFFLPIFIVLAWPMYIFFKTKFQSFNLLLTDKNLSFKYGSNSCFCTCWSVEERVVPLEKITDATFRQGWLQRMFDVEALYIRTAAGNLSPEGGGSGADFQLVGLIDARHFRDLILAAKAKREVVIARGHDDTYVPPSPKVMGGAANEEMFDIMKQQLACLQRMERAQAESTLPPNEV